MTAMLEKCNGYMDLRDVKTKEDFNVFYDANNLSAPEDKINYLTAAMKIRATRCDFEETKEEILADLEETALLGYWKASR